MLKKKRLQNKIAASRFSLPISATLIAMIWVAVGFIKGDTWWAFLFTVVSTLLMVELNNRNSLMRTYSRMVSCSFLVLVTMASLPHPSLTSGLVTMCFIAFNLIIWNGYQDRQSAGTAFYAFLFMGIASMAFIQVAFILPFLWIVMMAFTNSFCLRTFLASVIGFVTPYWFVAGYYAYHDQLALMQTHLASITEIRRWSDYAGLTLHQTVNTAYITLLGLIGTVHFLRTSYADKIRTRMIYESIIMLFLLIVGFILLQPQHILPLGGMMIVTVAPLIAHFITFTQGRIANISFIIMLTLTVAILAFNLFFPDTTL